MPSVSPHAMSRRSRRLFESWFVAGVLWTGVAAAKPKLCSPFSNAAALRGEGHLRAARATLQRCVDASECSTEVRRRCAAELQALATEMPSIVIHVHDGRGNDLVDVSVTLDGEPLVTRLDGLAIPVDPGEHQFVFQRGSEPPISRTERVEPTDKFRPIELALPDPNAPEEPKLEYVPREGPARMIAGVSLIGVGVAGVGAFALLGSSARSRERELQGRNCKPECAQGFVDSVSTRYTLSNISLAVGVVSLGAATWVLLSGPSVPKDPAPSAQVDVVAGPRGGTVTLSAPF
jgi:hypothetical protein